MKRHFFGISLYTSLSIFQGCIPTNNQKENSTNVDTAITAVQHPQNEDLDQTVIRFWDKFNFENTQLALSPEYGEQNLADFIGLISKSNHKSINIGFKTLIEKSSVNSEVQQYFEQLLQKYLYDVNSPFYNETYYIMVLENLINEESINSTNKERYKTILKIANKNKVGDKATDFTFFTTTNTSNNLYDYTTEHIILFFYEPGCPYCEEVINKLRNDHFFESLLTSKKATILAIYPDGEKSIWSKYAKNIPTVWINGIDLNRDILQKGLYDLKASPTIYLLDSNKKVILKDANYNQLIDVLK